MKCVTTATTGAAKRVSTGNDIAIARMRIAAMRGITMPGDDNSTTGSNVMLAIAQSDTTFSAAATAIRAGRSSGTMKTIAGRRRRGSLGHSISATSAGLGLATMPVSRIGAIA